MKYFLKYICIYFLLGFSHVRAYFGLEKIDSGIQGSKDLPLEILVQDYVIFLLSFIAIIAVLYGIWGGVMIFTAGGDEDRVKNGKKYLIYMVGGLVLIFLARPLVTLVLDILQNPGKIPT